MTTRFQRGFGAFGDMLNNHDWIETARAHRDVAGRYRDVGGLGFRGWHGDLVCCGCGVNVLDDYPQVNPIDKLFSPCILSP